MRWSEAVLVALILTNVGVLAFLGARSGATATRAGKILAFMALFLLPLLAGSAGFSEHLERSKTIAFCLSCHVMEDYGRSLLIDDRSHIPAVHFQNNLIPRDRACYTCHTDYTMFGGFRAKLRGLRHVYVQYLGHVPARLKLYRPYHNRECLYCHSGARSFEEAATHNQSRETMARIRSNQLSCLSCHDTVHDVENLKKATFWRGTLK